MELKIAVLLLLVCAASLVESNEASLTELNDCNGFQCPIGTYCILDKAANQPICKRLPTCKWRCRNCMLDTSYCTDPNNCVPRQICARGPAPCESTRCEAGQRCVNMDQKPLCIQE